MTKDKETEEEPPKENYIAPHGIPLGPTKQIEVTLPNDLTIVLTQTAFSQLFGYAQATDLEVSVLGIVDRGGSTFTVGEFFLVPQKGAHNVPRQSEVLLGQSSAESSLSVFALPATIALRRKERAR